MKFPSKKYPIKNIRAISESNLEAKEPDTTFIDEKGKLVKYKYQCVRCAECCRGNFEIYIREEDIRTWMKLEEVDWALESIRLRPEGIATRDEFGEYNKIGKTLKRLMEKYGEKNYPEKLEELKQFIEGAHLYFGEDKKRPEVHSILEPMRMTPILFPKDLKTIQKGLEWGLEYVICTDAYGFCPFLELNDCSINEYKPLACKSFPYDKEGNLKVNDYRLRTCQGFKKIQ